MTFDLAVSRTVPAPPEAVFNAWLDSTQPGGPWHGADRVILNPVVDGLFYHVVQHEGRAWPHYGRFIRLDRFRTIEFTWVSEATRGIETVVGLALAAADEGTLVTLRHTNVPDDEMGRGHGEGWAWCLRDLAERFGAAGAR